MSPVRSHTSQPAMRPFGPACRSRGVVIAKEEHLLRSKGPPEIPPTPDCPLTERPLGQTRARSPDSVSGRNWALPCGRMIAASVAHGTTVRMRPRLIRELERRRASPSRPNQASGRGGPRSEDGRRGGPCMGPASSHVMIDQELEMETGSKPAPGVAGGSSWYGSVCAVALSNQTTCSVSCSTSALPESRAVK